MQEEEEAQAKADKIKLALEKLKEAKVKKVSYISLLHGEVKLMAFYYTSFLKNKMPSATFQIIIIF